MKTYTKVDPFTLQDLIDLHPDQIFAKGEMIDSAEGINISNTGQMLKWIAKKGAVNDWAIYCHFATADDLFILRLGTKVTDKSNIRKCVPCTDNVLSKYRK